MRTLLVLLTAAVIAAPALAILPSPYIGANLQVNSPTGDFRKTDVVDEEGGAKTGLGGEVDVGITGGSGSLYVGYRFGKHTAEAKYEIAGQPVETSGDWTINRWVVGTRWHILGSTPIPIVPTLGGGVTLGKTEVTAKGSSGNINVDRTETSKSGFGWFLEAGGLFKPPGPLSLIANVQYHNFDADYQSELYDGKVKISFFTFQVGARFTILPV